MFNPGLVYFGGPSKSLTTKVLKRLSGNSINVARKIFGIQISLNDSVGSGLHQLRTDSIGSLGV